VNVLHVIPSVAAKEGGPSFAVKAMTEALARQGVRVTVATTTRSSEREDASTERRYSIACFRREFEPYKVSFGLTRWLRKSIAGFDLVHIHALFSFSSTMAARIARQHNVPYVVRPLGVLNRWGMENRRPILKRVSFRVVELPILLHSAAIHYTSDAERAEAASLDPHLAEHESVVIPLPVERVAQGNAERFLDRYPNLRGCRIILILSRIHPMKGIELLLDAFAMVRERNKDVALVIAGEGEKAYVRELRERARRLQDGARRIPQSEPATKNGRPTKEGEREYEQDYEYEYDEENIIWTGHLSGEMKAAALAAADVFVLPSASENFGIAAAESLAAGIPTIVSEEVALSSDIRRYDAGVVVQRDAQQLAAAISDSLSNKERAAGLAANGRRLAEERYSPEAVGRALHELYQKIIT
jgi:glycosyltransferase involved in cell wall biosynthesis